jgi:hypothetical protein
MKNYILYFLFLVNLSGFSQNIKSKFSFNIVGEVGRSKTESDKPDVHVPWNLQETYKGFKSGYFGEIIFKTNKIVRIGIGGGIENFGYSVSSKKKTMSDKYYCIIQYFNEEKIFHGLLQAGIAKGVITGKYVPDIGIGGTFTFKRSTKINIGLRPFMDFNWGESKDEMTIDCRISGSQGQPCPTTGYSYVLDYTTVSFNLSLIISLKIKDKTVITSK